MAVKLLICPDLGLHAPAVARRTAQRGARDSLVRRTQLLQRFRGLLDSVLVHLNHRAETTGARAEGLDRVDVDFRRRQFRQSVSDCTWMVLTGDMESRLPLSKLDFELLCGLLEEHRVFRNQVNPGPALADRIAPNADEIYAGFFEGAEQLRPFAGLIRNNRRVEFEFCHFQVLSSTELFPVYIEDFTKARYSEHRGAPTPESIRFLLQRSRAPGPRAPP